MNARCASRILLAVAVASAAPATALANPRAAVVGGQFRYWDARGASDLRDALVWWAPAWAHVQLEYWDFVEPGAEDSFRPEVGIHLRDRRRSVYTLQWRHERRQERAWAGTEQVVSRHDVVRAEVGPIVARDSKSWVVSGGLDHYWGSWHLAQVTLVRDPREGGLWIVPMRVRLATKANDWLQLTVAPASRRSLGWAVDAKWRVLRLGVERNNRFDFTRVDNTIISLGFERALGPTRD